MARARLDRRDGGIGHQLDVGVKDTRAVAVEDDGPVHLGEFVHDHVRDLDVDGDAPGEQRTDALLVGEHQQTTGAGPHDVVQGIPDGRARSDELERIGKPLAGDQMPLSQ